ncbi:MAG: hypothetical protein JRG96_07590 [Deltaproteobacteria bacterium]|nr:hypothetical protein [Deltaproteobacteria bacterium]MBW2417965.1 hypothetical protein [Deltaproteobacteria bacterium]
MEAGTDAIYRPPESDLGRPAEGGGNFGSLEKGLGGDFEFSISEILSEAWELTSGSKGAIIGGFAIYMAISAVANLASVAVTGIDPEANVGSSREILGVAIETLGFVLIYPLLAGIMLYSIKRAAGDPAAAFSDNFACYDRTFSIIGLLIVQTVLVLLGMLLFIIPGIYLSVAYGLAFPLLVEKNMGVWEALETSRKAVTQCWFRFWGLWIVMSVIALGGTVVTLGIGLIWLGPMAMLCFGVAYRNIFGYEGARA